MALSFSPTDVLTGWGKALTTPLGIILLAMVALYIILRITGVINWNPIDRFRKGGGGGQSGGGTFKQNPDYIIK